MDPFSFWDSLPIVGNLFASLPHFVKVIMTVVLVLVVFIALGKGSSGRGGRGKGGTHGRRSRRRIEQKGESERYMGSMDMGSTNQEASGLDMDLGSFDVPSGGGSLDELAGSGGQESVESLLAGQPVLPEEELLAEEKPKKEKKKPVPKEQKPRHKPGPRTRETKKKPSMGSTPGEDIGLPEELEEELEKEEGVPSGHETQTRQEPPIGFEEIKLPSAEHASRPKSGLNIFSSLFGGGSKQARGPEKQDVKSSRSKASSSKPSRLDIMKLFDSGKTRDDVCSILEKSGLRKGEAKNICDSVYMIWKEKRKPLLEKKNELENRRRVIQHKYLKMQIDETTFRKMMMEVQRQLVDVEAKIKASERYFT